MTARRGPADGPPLLWDRLTAAAVVGVLGYAGLLVVRGGVPAGMFDRLGFGMTSSGIVDAAARRHVLLVYGVLGAALIGWMTLLLAVVLGPLRRRERWAWRAVTLSTGLWFVVDTAFSLAVGSTAHAAFNLPFAVAIGVPLAAMRVRRPAAELRPEPVSRGRRRDRRLRPRSRPSAPPAPPQQPPTGPSRATGG